MIWSLRQRHRKIVLTLSAFLPAIFVWGIASRHAVPVLASWPRGLSSQPAGTYQSVWERSDLWEKMPLRTRLLSNSTIVDPALEVTAADPVVRPDVLVYWVAGNPKVDDSLPGDAVLLGAWMQEAKNLLTLPSAAKVGQGRLILYSLGNHEIVNTSKPFAIQ